jgi:hypothetical protein
MKKFDDDIDIPSDIMYLLTLLRAILAGAKRIKSWRKEHGMASHSAPGCF